MSKIRAALLACSLALIPASVGVAEDGQEKMRQGADLLQEGLELLLEDLLAELGPAWLELQEMIGDLSAYYPPEILPNGDIILRRKVPIELPPEGESEVEI
ncbi:MAG: hypothetical protein OEZ19_00610 [Paracoccaceae bacterium]|nr:hypothetical protein [Paracoccaceae bacterium]